MQDRIKQMAEEDGIDLDPHGGISRAYPVNLERFAQIVAEDLTSDDDSLAEKMAEHLYGHPRSDAIEWAKEDKFDSEKEKARLLIAVMREHIRARYGIKGE